MRKDYPAESELRKIQKWDFSKQPVGRLLDFVESIWHWPEWGFKKYVNYCKFSGKKCIKLELHTGGWSGNEQIIEALQKTKMFWFLYWELSKRGGHYFFEIPQLEDKP